MTARNGSFKSQMPSHYPMGYQLNLYARKEFGNDNCAKILHDSNYFKSIIYPFSGAVKRNTGLSARKLYNAAYSEFEKEVEKELEKRDFTETVNITDESKRTVTNYSYPKISEDGSVIARKSS